MDVMTDKQLQFIAWLITTATDKCKDIEEGGLDAAFFFTVTNEKGAPPKAV